MKSRSAGVACMVTHLTHRAVNAMQALRGRAAVPSLANATDSMSSWHHEFHDFQTENFLNLTAKGCA
jgi:hypothetical protein